MKITRLSVDGLDSGCLTDEPPTIAFALSSDLPGEDLARATVRVGDWTHEGTEQTGIRYGGPLEPYEVYEVTIEATGTSGAIATASTSFRTGRRDRPWVARWITDAAYETPRTASPVPMVFRTSFTPRRSVRRAWIEATALGVYEDRKSVV